MTIQIRSKSVGKSGLSPSYAVDIRPNDTQFAAEADAYQRRSAATRFEAVEFGSSWDTWYEVAGETYPFKSYKRVTRGQSVDTNNVLYWDFPSVPKWSQIETNQFTHVYTDPHPHGDVTEYASAVLGETAFSGLTISDQPAMATQARLLQHGWDAVDPVYGAHYNGNVFKGNVTGLRYGVYFYISYGGKSPTCIEPNKAMDLSIDKGVAEIAWCQGTMAVSGKSTQPPDPDLLGLTLNVAWALGANLVGKVFGTLASLYQCIRGDNSPGDDKVYARAEAYWLKCPENKPSSQGEGVNMGRIEAALKLTNTDGGTMEETIGVIKHFGGSEPVGTMMSVYMELSCSAQGESRHWGTTSASEFNAQSSFRSLTPNGALLRLSPQSP